MTPGVGWKGSSPLSPHSAPLPVRRLPPPAPPSDLSAPGAGGRSALTSGSCCNKHTDTARHHLGSCIQSGTRPCSWSPEGPEPPSIQSRPLYTDGRHLPAETPDTRWSPGSLGRRWCLGRPGWRGTSGKEPDLRSQGAFSPRFPSCHRPSQTGHQWPRPAVLPSDQGCGWKQEVWGLTWLSLVPRAPAQSWKRVPCERPAPPHVLDAPGLLCALRAGVRSGLRTFPPPPRKSVPTEPPVSWGLCLCALDRIPFENSEWYFCLPNHQ